MESSPQTQTIIIISSAVGGSALIVAILTLLLCRKCCCKKTQDVDIKEINSQYGYCGEYYGSDYELKNRVQDENQYYANDY